MKPKLRYFENSIFWLFFQEWVCVELVRTKPVELQKLHEENHGFFEIWIWSFSASRCPFLIILGVLKSLDFEVSTFLKILSCTCHMLHVPFPWKGTKIEQQNVKMSPPNPTTMSPLWTLHDMDHYRFFEHSRVDLLTKFQLSRLSRIRTDK